MRFALFLLALLPASCSGPDAAPGEAAVSSAFDAEFRWHARMLYGDLLTESCGKRNAGQRARSLAPERERVEAFEARMSAAAQGQLELARADALQEQEAEGRCEANDDPDFARLHLESARKDIGHGLEQLEAMAPRLEYSIPPRAKSAPRAAEFRYRVRKLVFAYSFMPCDVSTLRPNGEIFAPSLAGIAALKERLRPTPHFVHYAIAEADAAYEDSITMVECADPRPDDPARLRRESLASVRKEIAAIEALTR